MTLVERFEVLLFLVGVALVLKYLAQRLRLPQAATLILGGAALAVSPGIPAFELDPDFVLALVLPPLLLSSAYLTSWRAFRADLRIILQLAIGAVAFTTLAVGWAAHRMVPDLPWAACFALGAIVSPPDAVAASAVLAGLPLPRRIVTLLEGESLVNDATGLVLYRFAVAAALTGGFDAGQAVTNFLTLAIGGVAAGAALGFVVSTGLGLVRDAELGVTMSLLTAWVGYLGAERLHLSGVLATVACGIVMGWRQHELLDAKMRIDSRAVWNTLSFVLETLVFILIGLSLRGVLDRLREGSAPVGQLALGAGVIVATVILTRFAWVMTTAYLIRALLPSLRRRDPYPPLGNSIVLSWAGMRGVVSLAAALALPDGFPGRDFILATTFLVILVTVLVQGSTLASLIRLLRPRARIQGTRATLSEREARIRLTRAELEAVRALSTKDGVERHPRLMEQYAFRIEALSRTQDASSDPNPVRQAHFDAVLAGIAAARAELIALHRRSELDDALLHTLERELDVGEVLARHRQGG